MKNSYGIILLLLTFVCLSCGRQSVKPVADATNTTTPAQKVYGNPTVENGYLVFEDEAHLWQFTGKNATTKENRLKWEKSLDFTSMRTNFEILSDLSEKAGESELGYGMPLAEVAEKYKDIAVFERDGVFNVNCFYHPMAAVINSKGLVLIGDKLCKVDADKMLSVKNKDLTTLMANANITESKNGVTVEMVKGKLENNRQACNSSFISNGTTWVFGTTFYSSDNKYRTEFNVYMTQNGNVNKFVDYYYTVANYKKGALGIWSKNAFNVNATLSGTLDNYAGTTFTNSANMSVSQQDWDNAFANNLITPNTNPAPPVLHFQSWISACFSGPLVMNFPNNPSKTFTF